MKAMMSTGTERGEHKVDWFKGTRHRRGTAITRFTQAELGSYAFEEARRILGETEPQVRAVLPGCGLAPTVATWHERIYAEEAWREPFANLAISLAQAIEAMEGM